MARIVVLYNVLDTSRRRLYDIEPGTDLGAYLAEHEPLTGSLVHQVFNASGERIEPAGYAVRPGDSLLVRIVPGAWVIPYVIQAVVAFAVGYVLNRLFGPKRPKAGTTPSPSQVYGLAPPRNAARVGEPIPVVYGSPICTPDYATQPYSVYDLNNQFFFAILCIGQGFHRVDEMLLGDSSTSGLSEDVCKYWVFQPTDHLSTYGVIQAATNINENVATSADVADQELLPPNATESYTPSSWYWKTVLVTTSTSFPGGVPDMSNMNNAERLAALPANPALGTQATGVTSTYDDGTTQTYTIVTWEASPYVIGQTDAPPNSLIPGGTYSGIVTRRWVGPFETAKPGQRCYRIELDFLFSQGLYTMAENGALLLWAVDAEVEYTPIDDDGAAIGAPVVVVHNFVHANNTAQRYSRRIDVPLGRYRVRVSRVTNSDGKANTSDRMNWIGLKAYIEPRTPGQTTYGDVTLVAVRLRASNGIASDAASSVRFRVTRMLAPLGVGSVVPTVNPADAFVDVMTARYGGNRPRNDDELDLPLLNAVRTKWAAHNGFNAVFDQPSTVWEALDLSVQTVAAAPLPIGSRMSVVEDCVKPDRAQMFTDVNTTRGSLQVNHAFDRVGTPLGVRVEYRDPRTFTADAVLLPEGAPDYQTVSLFGCTSRDVASEQANLQMARREKQRTSIQFETELEGLTCMPGDRIGVQSKTMRWGQSGWIVADLGGNAYRVSAPLNWPVSGVPRVVMRDDEGRPHAFDGVAIGSGPDVIVLPGAPGFNVLPASRGDIEPTSFAFGVAGLEVTDWIVEKMIPQGDRVRIEGVNYAPAIYDDAMPHQRIPTL